MFIFFIKYTHDYLIGIAPQANPNRLHTRDLANIPKQNTALFAGESAGA